MQSSIPQFGNFFRNPPSGLGFRVDWNTLMVQNATLSTPHQAGHFDWKKTLLWASIAIGSFHLAYSVESLNWLIFVYLFSLSELINLPSSRQAFYIGFSIGFICFAPHLFCFYTIFGLAAIPLWAVLAFWHGIFLLLAWLTKRRFGLNLAVALMPFLWTGLEYFRSELYYLRFAWLTPGFVFSTSLPGFPMQWLGVYGTGFLLAAMASSAHLFTCVRKWIFGGAFLVLAIFGSLAPLLKEPAQQPINPSLTVAGLQMEFPPENEIPEHLTQVIQKFPDAQLLVMSEYSLDGEVPKNILNWCRDHKRYLLIGGKDPVGSDQYRNTAFVVGPQGTIVFRQAKSVPIQFFKDGLPATEQKLWDSPWGKIGVCICYDLSYTRVTDQLIRMGAQALIVPTMDVVEWGLYQHQLHARVARIRAAEYHVPLFRLASSGISQAVDREGRELGKTAFATEWAMLSQPMEIKQPGSLPLDRWLTKIAIAGTAFIVIALAIGTWKTKRTPALNVSKPSEQTVA
ncbi:MAG: Apolipoprotein N-acyltransferase-like protein [Verrucomicrobiales bacterium]|nr:Apolipoprotein N-acyltransferase-like protein [Verrucomicrobiales bacterium]